MSGSVPHSTEKSEAGCWGLTYRTGSFYPFSKGPHASWPFPGGTAEQRAHPAATGNSHPKTSFCFVTGGREVLNSTCCSFSLAQAPHAQSRAHRPDRARRPCAHPRSPARRPGHPHSSDPERLRASVYCNEHTSKRNPLRYKTA